MYLTYHEIVSIEDVLYDDWLDLYQTAFPLNEQMLVSSLNKSLRGRQLEQLDDVHYLAVLNEANSMVAMSRYDIEPSCHAAALWYLAVVPDGRSQGIGSQVYQEIRRRIAAEAPATRALFYEVEDPDQAHGADERQDAVRRIRFYQRNGARLLRGIHYVQSVGWQPPVPMHIMVHLYGEMEIEQVFAAAQCLFEDALQQVGPLTLE